jgi:hypothetical protein
VTIRLETLGESDLVQRFSDAAKEMGAAVLDSEVPKANRKFRIMREIDLILRSRGQSARLKLLPLLDDQDRFVRYYAAKKLLGLDPARARAEIEWNATHWFDALSGDAKGLLRAFDSGQYRPD